MSVDRIDTHPTTDSDITTPPCVVSHLFGILSALMLLAASGRCSSTDDATESPGGTWSIEGFAQKGPFVNGSSVTVHELDEDFVATGRTFSTEIEDDKGSFSVPEVELVSSHVRLSADGFYFNEISGELSAARLEIHALADLSDVSTANVNLLSHLERPRVECLLAQGESFEDAKRQAQQEVLAIFNIDEGDLGPSEQLDISRGQPGDTILLAVSAVLQGSRSTAELTQLLFNLSTDLREDGVLDDEDLGSALQNDALSLDADAVSENLETRYAELGVNAEIGDFDAHVAHFVETAPYEPSEPADAGVPEPAAGSGAVGGRAPAPQPRATDAGAPAPAAGSGAVGGGAPAPQPRATDAGAPAPAGGSGAVGGGAPVPRADGGAPVPQPSATDAGAPALAADSGLKPPAPVCAETELRVTETDNPCRYDLPEPPPGQSYEPALMSVQINGVEMADAGNCETDDGFVVEQSDPEAPALVFCGADCDELPDSPTIRVTYSCP